MTQEEIQKSITSAFDSVNLITALNEKESLTNEELETKARNQAHLSIMIEKDWFLEALTEQQEEQILAVL